MKHFEFKHSLFGYAKLVDSIRLDDLNEDDTESYLSGTFQVLSSSEDANLEVKKKDRFGRPVTWLAPHLGQFKSYESMVSCWRLHVLAFWKRDVELATIGGIVCHLFIRNGCAGATDESWAKY